MTSLQQLTGLEHIAFLIVDVQKDFISGSLKVGENAVDIVAPINALRKDIPFGFVVHTKDSHPPNHCSFVENNAGAALFSTIQVPAPDGSSNTIEQVMWPTHCVEGSEGWQFHDELVVEETDFIQRKGTNPAVDSYSGFFDNYHNSSTGLAKVLRDRNITDVYVCGLAYDYCAGSTACDAANLGFNTFLIKDLTRHTTDTTASVMDKKLDEAGVQTIHSSDIVKMLQGPGVTSRAVFGAGSDTEIEELPACANSLQSSSNPDFEQAQKLPTTDECCVTNSCGTESCEITPTKQGSLDSKRRRIHVPPNE